MHIIAKNIKQLRQEKNWTQQEMADMLFVTRQTVSNWENGKALPDVETLLKIAEKLNIDVNDLVYGKNNSNEILKKDMLKTLLYLSVSAILYVFFRYLGKKLIQNYTLYGTLVYGPYLILRPLALFFSGRILIQLFKITGVIRHTKGIKNIHVFKNTLIGMLILCFVSCFDIIRLDILLCMYRMKKGPFVNATGFDASDWALNLPPWLETIMNIPNWIICSGSTFYRPPYYLLIIILGIAYELAKPYNPTKKS